MNFNLRNYKIDADDFKNEKEELLFNVMSEVIGTVVEEFAGDFLLAFANKDKTFSLDKNEAILRIKNSEALNENLMYMRKNLSNVTEKDIFNVAICIGILSAFNTVNTSLEVMKKSGGHLRKLMK